MLALFLLLLSLAGCTGYSGIRETDLSPDTEVNSENTRLYWWRTKFRLQLPEGEQPDFSTHLLIADQVIRPVLDQYALDIKLWRVHRRAARDHAGHQLTLIFYAKRSIALKVQNDIESSPVVAELFSVGVLDALVFTDSENNQAIEVEATSDPDWPLPIQQSWPWFSMGVSKSWLDLIARERDDSELPVPESITEKLYFYDQLNDRVVAQWGQYGRHAYLHHLNAIFGYTPVYMIESGEWWNF